MSRSSPHGRASRGRPPVRTRRLFSPRLTLLEGLTALTDYLVTAAARIAAGSEASSRSTPISLSRPT